MLPQNLPQLVGNKAKGRISKLVFQGNKARQSFLETPVLRFALLPYYRLFHWSLIISFCVASNFLALVCIASFCGAMTTTTTKQNKSDAMLLL